MAVKKYTMLAREALQPIIEPVTKLGGQPVWLDEPCWPLSTTLSAPMRFVGQFVLYPEIFGDGLARIAYLFMTEADDFVDGTWLPDGGENAVILQPGTWTGLAAPLTQGPTLFEIVAQGSTAGVREVSREYAITLEPGEDPDIIDEQEFRRRGAWDDYCRYRAESKIGGTPAFLQFPQYPDAGRWRLLAQINSSIVPAGPNFGDAGIGYAFLSEDGRYAKFLWQG